jgi:hypothetical protein
MTFQDEEAPSIVVRDKGQDLDMRRLSDTQRSNYRRTCIVLAMLLAAAALVLAFAPGAPAAALSETGAALTLGTPVPAIQVGAARAATAL